MLPNRCQGMAPTTQTAPFCAEKESADGEAVQERRPGSFLVLSLRTRLLFERSPPPARLPIPDLLHQSHGRLPTIREHLPEEVSFPIFGQGSKVVQSLRVGNRLLVVRNRFLVFLTRGGIDDDRRESGRTGRFARSRAIRPLPSKNGCIIGIGAALTDRSPPTPPGMRVRTRRFEKLRL